MKRYIQVVREDLISNDYLANVTKEHDIVGIYNTMFGDVAVILKKKSWIARLLNKIF